MSSFGWGHRQCLGMTLTQDELIVACGSLAWAFTLKHKKDPLNGQDIPVPLDKSNSLLIIKPDPFQMVFEPRSAERRVETLRLWEEADANDMTTRDEFVRAAKGVTFDEKCASALSMLPAVGASVPKAAKQPALACSSTSGIPFSVLSAVKKQDVIIQINRVNSYPNL